jgi:hypothetical protein
VCVLDVQDCGLSAVFLVAVASFLEDSQDDVTLPRPKHKRNRVVFSAS